MASPSPTSLNLPTTTSPIFDTHLIFGETEPTLLRFQPNLYFSKSSSVLRVKPSRMHPVVVKAVAGTEEKIIEKTSDESGAFSEMKQRFLSFKREKYLKNMEYFEGLAQTQKPKFTVIACADSRVCPSNILGFQPGEAFVVRNVANMVPPFETGPSETKAALEFSVNALQVENILIIGHSRCGGIRALMSMPDEDDSRSFISSWVSVGKNAKLSIQSVASHLEFDHQCTHCEKESVNHSLSNLLTYPWIKERVAKGELSLHGGYYDFTDCRFEKWTLDYEAPADGNKFSIKDQEVWQ